MPAGGQHSYSRSKHGPDPGPSTWACHAKTPGSLWPGDGPRAPCTGSERQSSTTGTHPIGASAGGRRRDVHDDGGVRGTAACAATGLAGHAAGGEAKPHAGRLHCLPIKMWVPAGDRRVLHHTARRCKFISGQRGGGHGGAACGLGSASLSSRAGSSPGTNHSATRPALPETTVPRPSCEQEQKQ